MTGLTLDQVEVGKPYRLNDRVLPSLVGREGVIVRIDAEAGDVLIDMGADGRYWVSPGEMAGPVEGEGE